MGALEGCTDVNLPELEGLTVQTPAVASDAVIDRPRLLRRLTGDSHASIAVLVAPGGYGKTTLLAQWEAADERGFTWLAVDSRHDDPTMLVGAIAAALDRTEPLGEDVFAPLMAPRPNLWKVVLPRLCGAISRRRRPFVLVLDDLHRLDDPAAVEPLAMIAESVPERSRLAIASREAPTVPLGRLRTQRGVIEISARDLAMTATETSTLFGRLAGELDEVGIERLLERTEGWPAGIYLAALTVSDDEDAADAVERFCGDDRIVAEYLQQEFLESMSVEDRSFLTRSSALETLSGPVCDAVLERAGSQADLKRLARSNLLIAALDRRGREYRCHALLRELLSSELDLLPDVERTELHARACRWFSERGELDEAVEHAIAGGDRELAADLIWRATAAYESSGRHRTLRRWLDRFSEAERVALPPLCLTEAAGHTTLGDGVGCEHWSGVALEGLRDTQREDVDLLRAAARVVRATGAARDGVVRMREDVGAARGLLPVDSPWRALCCLVEGTSWQLTGDREVATTLLEEGARRGLASAPNVGTLCLAQLATMAIDEGEHDRAEDMVRRALDHTEHFGLADHPTMGLLYAVSALVAARAGRADDAVRAAQTAERLLTVLNEFSPWYETEVRILLARALLLLDDVGRARGFLAAAGRLLQRCFDAVVLREWIEAAWQEADAARSITGRWPLSPAELRLLHYLPTHLTFKTIAEQVFVSQNTVKTQARSIYRKLGVSSRSEAVACARAAGLLDGDDERGT